MIKECVDFDLQNDLAKVILESFVLYLCFDILSFLMSHMNSNC